MVETGRSCRTSQRLPTCRSALGWHGRVLGSREEQLIDRIRSFREELSQEKERLRPLQWWQLANQVFHADRGSPRPFIFPDMIWQFGEVPLDRCSVWQGENERSWFRGTVPDLAADFARKKRQLRTDKVIRMSELFDRIASDEMPLIVIRTTVLGDGFQIDDGNHRAIAAWIAQRVSLPAVIGSPHPFNDGYRQLVWAGEVTLDKRNE